MVDTSCVESEDIRGTCSIVRSERVLAARFELDGAVHVIVRHESPVLVCRLEVLLKGIVWTLWHHAVYPA